jgi:hypothetical protein
MLDTKPAHAHHGVSRRTVARTAAWAVPVVITAVGAPAYAATSGTPTCTDSGTAPLTVGNQKVTTLAFMDATGKATGVSASVAITATDKTGKALPPNRQSPDTGTVATTDYSPGWNDLILHMPKGLKQGDTLKLTLTFSKPVKNATLSMTDIDKLTQQWIDNVVVSPSGFSVATKGPDVSGSGTTADPFTANVEAEIHTNAGDLTLVWPGTVTSVTVTYIAADKDNKSELGQHIGIGKFGYNNCL